MFVVACSSKHNSNYTSFDSNILYRLIAFSNTDKKGSTLPIINLQIEFLTQNDSIFWDSFNNNSNAYFVDLKNTKTSSFTAYLNQLAIGDSCELHYNVHSFFRDVFKLNKTPFFSKNDSIVKIRLKALNFQAKSTTDSATKIAEIKEDEKILNFAFGGNLKKFQQACDSFGVFWLSRPKQNNNAKKPEFGNEIQISYAGYFLNGRIADFSAKNFTIIYGQTFQVIEGLNYVIKKLKIADTVKIILPSHLAFGEKGSVNLLIPPYTPLAYTITINRINKK